VNPLYARGGHRLGTRTNFSVATLLSCRRLASFGWTRLVASPSNGGARRILSLADGIRIRSGRLRFTRSGLTRELDTFLARGNRFGESFTGRLVQRVPRPGAAPAYLMIAMPWVGRARAGALLILEDFAVPPALGGELRRFVYGLTKAETRIATRLIKGLSTSEIGTDLGLPTLTGRL